MAALSTELEVLEISRGDILVRQGEVADALFIVLSGRFIVTREGRETPVTEIAADQPIGEIAFLTGSPRTASVRALRDSLVLKLSRDQFERLAATKPSIWRSLTATLAQRLAETTSGMPAAQEPRPRVIAVIRAGGHPVPAAFLNALVAALSSDAETLVLDSSRGIPGGGAQLDTPEATRALNALEQQYRTILLIADDTLTPWSEKVLRHADLVLAVGCFEADTKLNPLEQRASELLQPDAIRLVLLHSRRAMPQGTARWLDRRKVAMHHHVALDDKADIERLLRFVNGTALGFVACGGGALCAAHVGVYKALTEAGFQFDMFGGTSAGSAMAAAFAIGTSPDEVDRGIHDIFVSNRAMGRYTWPRYSLLDHRHFDDQLARYFGQYEIEDLWLPFFAVSTNLSRFCLNQHRRGSLFAAIRASSSIPALLPPVYTPDGEMLVDGCLLNNVPVSVMRQLKRGPNIVVSFSLPQLERFSVDYAKLPSRGELMRRALSPLKRREMPKA
ncbi:MAG TPA: cyclic nucleotide-binding and patatin-like phospholipase domain-containing protein, partial [Steroidobacteraceae bacterium]